MLMFTATEGMRKTTVFIPGFDGLNCRHISASGHIQSKSQHHTLMVYRKQTEAICGLLWVLCYHQRKQMQSKYI